MEDSRENKLTFFPCFEYTLFTICTLYILYIKKGVLCRKKKEDRERSLSLFSSLFIEEEGFGRMLLPEIQVVWYGYIYYSP
jgi:hypothetical protein